MEPLVIPNAATVSQAIGGNLFDFLRSLSIHAPASLAGVTKIEVADTEPDVAVAGDFRDLQSAGADITIPADSTIVLENISYRSLRLSTTVAPGAGGETYDVTAKDATI